MRNKVVLKTYEGITKFIVNFIKGNHPLQNRYARYHAADYHIKVKSYSKWLQ